MLILTRRVGEILNIGDNVTVCVISASDEQVRLGICAPREVVVDRLEIHERKLREQRANAGQMDTAKPVLEKGIL